MSDATVIRTVGLRKVYASPPSFGGFGPPPAAASAGPRAAVESLDLEVHAGEIFGLLGPNGAGKTTTIGMLTTRVIPTSGSATIGGIDVVADPARVKRSIGVVTQTNTLDRGLDVRENLVFHGRYFGMSAKAARVEADRLLQVFRLGEKANASVNTLSGGMAQRLMAARGIMHRPQVLFLDEPTAGLDPQSRLVLWEIIRELNASEGQTVLLTTHYMEEADSLCSRLAIMDHGRILALDTPNALKRTVAADTVVAVSAQGDQAALGAVLAAVDGVTKAEPTPHGVEAHVRGGHGVVPRLLTAALDAGFDVSDVSVAEPSLETVFIQLTGKDLRD